jgi:large conductance mechanosensitive channel
MLPAVQLCSRVIKIIKRKRYMEMVKEFKEFISKGNVMDMAVGIIIGGAFTAIVTALVDSILMPVIGALCGGLSVADMSITVGNAAIGYGAFIQAIIDFLLVAWVLFMIIKALNKAKAAAVKEEEPAPEEPEEKPADIVLLEEIRDLLKK